MAGTYPFYGLRFRLDEVELITAEPQIGINMAPISSSALNAVTLRPGGQTVQSIICFCIIKIFLYKYSVVYVLSVYTSTSI